MFWEGSGMEGWLREKGLLPSNDEDKVNGAGWSDEPESDLSDMEDEAWIAGGEKSFGGRGNEGFSSDEALGDEWISDEDDDDHGGEMMPLPTAVWMCYRLQTI